MQIVARPAFWIFLFVVFNSGRTIAQVTLSGYLRDAESGETLVGANVYLAEDPAIGTVTNAYGFYSLSVDPGTYEVVYSYLGYDEQRLTLALSGNTRQNIRLTSGITIEEVVVTAEDEDRNVESTDMGRVDLPIENIQKLPSLFGEVDVLKAIQLLPGVTSAGEGTSGFFVRGGGVDQNLVLLDEALVYNSGHLLGFFSVFNPDAIKNTTLIKGGIPARYGGRLSSVVDIQMKEGNDQQFQLDGGIGLISSRLTAQGPIIKDRSSFIVSGRRTYVLDLAQPALRGSDFEGTNYYFYDFNAKVNYRFSDRDRIYLSAYFGRDVLKFRNPERDFNFDLPYGNATTTLRWNHLFNDKLFSNVSVIYNDYDFEFGGGQDDFQIDVFSGVRDWNIKADLEWYPAPEHSVQFGANYTYHKLIPNIANATSGDEEFSNNLEARYAHETAWYIQDDIRISPRLRANIGLRFSTFTQLGPYTSGEDGRTYERREPVTTYVGLEPRVSTRFAVSPNASLKAGLTVTNQYLHLVSNSSSTLPADIWVPSTERVKPQRGLQYSLGYFRNFSNNRYEASLEVYYKTLRDQIDYREDYVNDPAEDLENEFVFGEGKSYGLELLVRKNKGLCTGWIAYTLSRTERQFDDINNGEVYPTQFDRRHDISLVANYTAGEKWELGGTFVFATGSAFTPLRSVYLIGQDVVPRYGDRNSARIEDYHRLDLSATFTPSAAADKRFKSSWTFGVYNTYSRLNPFFVYYDFETDPESGTAKGSAYKVALFPVIPSVTWNFSWK